MKRINLKKVHISREWLYNQLFTPFKKPFQIIDDESASTSDQVSEKGLPAVYLAYDERQRLDARMLEMGIHKAEAIKSIRERTRLA